MNTLAFGSPHFKPLFHDTYANWWEDYDLPNGSAQDANGVVTSI